MNAAGIPAKLAEMDAALAAAGYPAKADPARINKPLVVAILFYLVLLVTMVYGPIAALLVELFPSRIRYTAMSLPSHIGNGRSEEHTSELQSLMRISYAVFCMKTKKHT